MLKNLLITFFLFVLFLFLGDTLLFASEESSELNLLHRMNTLVFQLAFIVFAAWAGGVAFQHLRLPPVLGEIIAGIVIGPYCLGQIPFWGFAQGLFPVEGAFPVSVELYGLATIASIMLLFLAGLETDVKTFLKYSVVGSVVGFFGVIFSFLSGQLLGVLYGKMVLHEPIGLGHPLSLFLGVISTATSVGISARILSEKKKMDSPEGVTILSAAVIDDVLGIIILAVIMGIIRSGQVGIKQVAVISLKAIVMWVGFTVVGLKYSQHLTKLLKRTKNKTTIAIMCFALALLLAGIFEKSGLAMIIGAYVMGLSLSKTDISLAIQEKLEVLHKFLIPIFFCVMGMLIDLEEMGSREIISLGMIFVGMAVAGKLIGCGLPTLFMNFNLRGALRIGVGMVPRGEVALIIAGIGLTSGIIDDKIFSISIIMTFITTLITPPILDKLLTSDKPVLRKKPKEEKEHETIEFTLPNPETTSLLANKLIDAFAEEGFYVNRIRVSDQIYRICKDETFITLNVMHRKIEITCPKNETAFVYTVFYEVISELENFIRHLQNLADKDHIKKGIFGAVEIQPTDSAGCFKYLTPEAVDIRLQGKTKEEVFKELLGLLVRSGQLTYREMKLILKDLIDHEEIMSTGMQDSIALPHAKTDHVNDLMVSVGVNKQGLDFNAVDQKPSHIFILTLSPKKNPESYLQSIAQISKFLLKEENRRNILACETNEELIKVLKGSQP